MIELRDLRGVLPWNGDGSRWATRPLDCITQLVVHHSGTGENRDPLRTVRAFNRGHIARNGWPRIAYHYVIDSRGVVYWTNRNRDICTHSGSKATNARSLGVCLIGDFAGMGAGKGAACCAPTGAQLEALRALRVEVSERRGRALRAVPHYEVVETSCPGRGWWERDGDWVNGGDRAQRAAPLQVGIHLPNDGVIAERRWAQIAQFGLVKGLVRLDVAWGELDWRKLAEVLRDDCTVILRLYFPGRLDADEFVARAAAKLRPILDLLGEREVLIEIHNEPNHVAGIEGWGQADEQAADFARWYARVLWKLRGRGFTGLGWPGLAVGEWVHGERSWALENRANLLESDWIGVHCYWQRPEEMGNVHLGENWLWYRNRWPDKRIFVTECGNSSCQSPALPQVDEGRQAAEYVEWCRQASAGGVAGVAFFMMDGSEEWRRFRLYDRTLRALASAEVVE